MAVLMNRIQPIAWMALAAMMISSSPSCACEAFIPSAACARTCTRLHSTESDALPKQSLYEVLGAKKTASRADLRKKYMALARVSHPDSEFNDSKTDFQAIAEAWKVLGNEKTRRKYDRTLRAEEISAIAQKFANDKLEEAVPAVAKALDDVAVPFLRRTTATTWAVAEAAAKGVTNFIPKNGNSGKDEKFENAFQQAIEAGRRAGRAIDTMELTEKSTSLAERAQEEVRKMENIDRELEDVTEKRLLSTLQSSNFALSSVESYQVLEKLAAIDENVTSQSLMERSMLCKTLEEEITTLRAAELKFADKLDDYKTVDVEWNKLLDDQQSAKDHLAKCRQAELDAMEALQKAQQRMATAKETVLSTSQSLRDVEDRLKRNASEMDKVTAYLSKRQQRVRSQLRKKLESILSQSAVKAYSQYTEEDLKALRQRELQLLEERQRIENMVDRLQSRANKLNSRAAALEEWEQTNGDAAPSNGTASP